ncbi:hypothetical protein LUZ63_002838 [Rhynchospora breviuscula]|uniref:KIB1-4 beta-propeller domain-containing protein n=1 Tax=Rhynchospora breviuscula TaxID=2022672 RepID=A0A9Q0CZK2_9POAL|nr:hypothetical protein LUZ63_002838 [Rhynchospora breviuscula]
MLAYDYKRWSLSLLNHLTGREISLPPLALTWCQLLCVRSDPTGSGVFVAIYRSKVRSEHHILASCRVGDSNWVTVEQPHLKSYCHFQTYYKGMFYVHNQDTRITEVIDATTGAIVHLIPPQEYAAAKPRNAKWCFDFFVESGGDLLGISSIYGTGLRDTCPTKCYFQIHRLDEGNGNPRWVPMKSIGNRFLFLHASSGVSYDASDFPGLKGNSIYFLGSVMHSNLLIVSSYLVNFDIERGTAKRLQCPAHVDTWFLPGLH